MPTFDASASALGYLHQLRWALLELLRSARDDQGRRVNIELLDDVAIFDENGKPLKAAQLKHHRSPANLTDMHGDLWKTLRVWIESPALRSPDGPHLYLITTDHVSPYTAAAFLTEQNRNIEEAARLLDNAALKSESDATKTARESWLSLEKATRLALLNRTHIVGDAPLIHNVDSEIQREFQATVHPAHMARFVEGLYGWWDNACIEILQRNRTGDHVTVSGLQLYNKTRSLRDDFILGALPVDYSLAELTEEEIRAHHSMRFVEQLNWALR